MRGCLRGCLGTVGVVAVVTAIAWVGWRSGDRVFPRLEALVGIAGEAGSDTAAPVPTPELAEATLERVDRLRSGEGEPRLELAASEITSVMRYALPGVIPPGVEDPQVRLAEGKVHVAARIALAAFPDLPALEDVAGLLPDTVDLALRGTLLPFDAEHAVLHVERVEASRIPLPARMIPPILRGLGRTDRPGLPADALLVPLPEGLASAYVEADRLVLVADR